MMRIDVSDLLKEIDVDLEEARKFANKLASELHAGLVRATPVDTGRARNGWELELGDTPVVQNMVPYIGVLNDGHSKQAPKMFVEAEIDRVTRSVKP